MSREGRVLIVDDDAQMVSLCRRVADKMGLAADAAASAAEAERLLSEKRYDIVLSDNRMKRPDDGVRLAASVRRLWSGTAVILMTGDPGLDSAVPAVRSGVFDYLPKPFKLEELERTLARCLAERRLDKELPVADSLRAELSAAYGELKKVEALKEAILSRVNHELRTPLTVIEIAAAALAEEECGAESARLRRRLVEAAARLKDAVGQLLLHSRLTRDARVARDAVSLPAIVAALAEALRPLWEERGISFTFAAEGPAQLLTADEELVRTAVRNLLLNAIRFNKEGGAIEVRLAFDESEAALSVRDTGPGFDAAHAKLMLDGFYQAADFMTRRVGGLGLGLATARLVAERHGGSLSLSSAPGQGSVFTLRLPVREE